MSNSTMATPPTFLSRWNTLSDELKLEILKYTVPLGKGHTDPCDNSYSCTDFALPPDPQDIMLGLSLATLGIQWQPPQPTPVQLVLYPLLSIPEIKGLVTEAFYTQNSFTIHQSFKYDEPAIRQPPATANAHIRGLHIRLCYINPLSFAFLCKLSTGGLGFAHLQSLEVEIVDDEVCLDGVAGLEFPVKRLVVRYSHFERSGEEMVDEKEGEVLGKFTICGMVKKTVVRWYDDKEEKTVGEWTVYC
jgi:hypothetical protein